MSRVLSSYCDANRNSTVETKICGKYLKNNNYLLFLSLGVCIFPPKNKENISRIYRIKIDINYSPF